MDSLIITRGGKELVSRLIEGSTTVKFTKIRTSDHDYSAISDLTGISELESIKQEVPISKITRVDDTTVVVRALMDNKDLSEGYYVRNAGLYAKDGEENEILFGISVADEADHMPAYGNSRPSGIIFTMNVLVDNAKQVVLNIDPTGAATIQDIMDIESPEFDDSGTVEGISSFPSFLETMKSKMNFFQFFRNLKAGLQFVLHTGQIVNNCVTDNAGLPLSAAQGKALMDKYTQLYSEKITLCGNITDLSTLVSLSQQNKTVYIGYIDWRQTDILPLGSKSGTTICFASNWWIWALSGSKEFFCLTQEAKWEKAPYLLSSDLTDFQNKFFINMTNYTFDDLKKVYTGVLPKIGFVGYSGPFTPNRQTGYVLCGGSCALLFSVNGDRYRYNPGIGDTAWVKLT